MSYRYENHREWLATDAGVAAVGEVLRNVERRLKPAGAATMDKIMPSAGDSWNSLAAVDHVVLLGVIEEVQQRTTPAGQDRVFVVPRR